MGENRLRPLPTVRLRRRTCWPRHGLLRPAAAIIARRGRRTAAARGGRARPQGQAVAADLPQRDRAGAVAAWPAMALFVVVALIWLVPDRRLEAYVARHGFGGLRPPAAPAGPPARARARGRHADRAPEPGLGPHDVPWGRRGYLSPPHAAGAGSPASGRGCRACRRGTPGGPDPCRRAGHVAGERANVGPKPTVRDGASSEERA